MSRAEENKNMIKKIKNIDVKDLGIDDNGYLIVMNTILIDISKSLAVIADKYIEEEDKHGQR